MNATLRSYVRSFRIKELMQCLEALGLSKKGKKAELQARLLAYFDGAESGGLVREQWKLDAAAKVITAMHYQMLGVQPPPAASPQADDTRQDAGDGQGPAKRMRVEGASPAYPHVQREQIPTGSSSSPGLQNGHVPMQPLRNGLSPQYTKLNNRRIRCNCGVHVDRGSMLQCKTCSVWQHAPCAVQPGAVAPDPFMCDMCRLARVDPYWTQSEELVATTRLRPQVGRGMTAAAANGTQLQVLERGFNLSAAQYNQVRGAPGHYQIQVACMLMDDVVPNRYHWPCNADLRINNMQYRPYGRHANTKLGPNGRDEPASIAVMCYAGRNRITLTCLDSRPFYMVVRIVRKLSMEEVKAMMHAPETMEQAVARVKSQVRGGKAAADGNDSDDDLITLSTIVSLKCPLSGSRIETPGRFHGVAGLGTFDLDTFLCMAERSRKWQCPHSLRNLSVHELQTDVYVARLLTCLQASPDILEVELDPEGRWRPAGSTGDWHDIMADPATLVALIVKVKPEPEAVMAGDDSDEEEELSAAEELRRAASAYAAASKPRQPPKPPSPEVIDLISDSSDDEQQSPPPARRTLLTAVQANPSLLRPSQAAVQQNRSNGGAGPSGQAYNTNDPTARAAYLSQAAARARAAESQRMAQRAQQVQQQQSRQTAPSQPPVPGMPSIQRPQPTSPQLAASRQAGSLTIRLPNRQSLQVRNNPAGTSSAAAAASQAPPNSTSQRMSNSLAHLAQQAHQQQQQQRQLQRRQADAADSLARARQAGLSQLANADQLHRRIAAAGLLPTAPGLSGSPVMQPGSTWGSSSALPRMSPQLPSPPLAWGPPAAVGVPAFGAAPAQFGVPAGLPNGLQTSAPWGGWGSMPSASTWGGVPGGAQAFGGGISSSPASNPAPALPAAQQPALSLGHTTADALQGGPAQQDQPVPGLQPSQSDLVREAGALQNGPVMPAAPSSSDQGGHQNGNPAKELPSSAPNSQQLPSQEGPLGSASDPLASLDDMDGLWNDSLWELLNHPSRASSPTRGAGASAEAQPPGLCTDAQNPLPNTSQPSGIAAHAQPAQQGVPDVNGWQARRLSQEQEVILLEDSE